MFVILFNYPLLIANADGDFDFSQSSSDQKPDSGMLVFLNKSLNSTRSSKDKGKPSKYFHFPSQSFCFHSIKVFYFVFKFILETFKTLILTSLMIQMHKKVQIHTMKQKKQPCIIK